MGIDGHYKECPTIEATFNFEGVDYTSTFSVFDTTDAIVQVQRETGAHIHGIIGMAFLTENKWIIDFNKLMVRADDSE